MTDCDEIIQLEAVLYEKLAPGRHQMKVAMLLAVTFGGKTLPSDHVVNAALERLAQRSDIETSGDIRTWRRSEIRRLNTAQ